MTDAGAVMIVSNTPGVGATLNIATGVHTPVLALHTLADLVVAAVQVGGAGGALAACPHVIGVTLESRETQTGAILTHSVGSTPLVAAQVRHQRLVSVTAFKWVSLVSRLTSTVETSRSVDTDSVPATGAGSAALVDVVAADEGVAIIALLTLAHLASVAIGGALGIVSTLTGDCHTHISGGGTALIRVASKARVTLASVGDAVDTVTVVSTPRGAHCRQDGRHAQEVSISHKSLSAEALVGVGVTGCVEAT